MNSINSQQSLTKDNRKPVLEPFKNQRYKLKNTISAIFYFKKPYQEAYTNTPLKRKRFRKNNTLFAD